MPVRYYRRPWNEPRGDDHSAWGHSFWYFELDDAGYAVRQLEQYEKGPSLGYDAAHSEDDYGGLTCVSFDPVEYAEFEITREEFEKAWTQRAGPTHTATWRVLCDALQPIRCWKRLGVGDHLQYPPTAWSMPLTVPVDGYIESGAGPVPMRDVEWIELSTLRIRGGMAGVPLEFVDITDELVHALRGAHVESQFRVTRWSMNGIFDDREVRVLRVTLRSPVVGDV